MKGNTLVPVITAAMLPLLLFVLIIASIGFGLVAWRPPLLWIDKFGTTDAANGVTSIVVDGSSRYVSGYLNATAGTTGTPFIRKYDLNGAEVWTRTLSSSPSFDTYPLLSGVSANADGIFVLGRINANLTILKYDFSGNQLWTRQLGTDWGGDAIVATSTGLFVAGETSGLNANETSFLRTTFLREYDPSGNILWTHKISNSPVPVAGIYADSAAVFVLTDNSLLKYDPSGKALWAIAAAGTGLAGDSTGTYVSNESLTKFSSDGNLRWSLLLQVPDNSGAVSSHVSADGSGVYVPIDTGAGNEFIMKYDSAGSQISSSQFYPSATRLVSSRDGYVVTVASGGVYLAGSTHEGQSDYALIEELAQSSSLVFFGINPPVSLVFVGILCTAVVLSSFLLIRRHKRMLRPRRVSLNRDRTRT